MKTLVRFGKKIPLPSTLQIISEMRALAEDDAIRARCAEEDGLSVNAAWTAICARRAEKRAA